MALLAVVGCGSDKDDNASTATPDAACKNLVATICSKYFGCYSQDELDTAAPVIGNNEADCRTKFAQQQCTTEQLKCDSGKTYSSSKASECLDQYNSLSCKEFTDDNAATPAACDAVCM